MAQRIFITGVAGFIGFHLARLLLDEGAVVEGYDGVTDYYDPRLKERRLAQLNQSAGFHCTRAMLEDAEALNAAVTAFAPDVIVHLAGQAGVRYGLENPRSYVDSNVVGTFNMLEAARQVGVGHLMLASTSSVYGGNEKLPFSETDMADHPLSIYAATKKANEAMGHSYAHLHGLPVTLFRFFTVYGPWGRPDMALFKFTQAILNGQPIDIYNHGEMYRDFTYVSDLVRGIRLLMGVVPGSGGAPVAGDSLSPVAPYRVVNIGNSEKVRLLDFITALEEALGTEAIRNEMPMQLGDVPATWANADLLRALTGYAPETDYRTGIAAFVAWFRDYYDV